MHIEKDYSLQAITTFHLPAKCKYFVEYNTIAELKEFINSELAKKETLFQIGGGSNLLFTKDFDGIILHSCIKFINIISEDNDGVIVEAGAGIEWDEFVKYCVSNSFSGVENLSYIPGEVGASAIQNIGSYGAEVKDVIYCIHTVEKETGMERIFMNDECDYGYRDSIFKKELKDKYIVTSVEYKLSKKPSYILDYGPLKKLLESQENITLQKIRETIIMVRTSKLPDPKEIGSVGSFFKNPVISIEEFKTLQTKYPDIAHYIVDEGHIKVPAGWLIEHAGLKGYRIGQAGVYEKQCLVIVNWGGASSNDIIALYQYVISTVKKLYNIELHPEANII